jgi:hypothetical protein
MMNFLLIFPLLGAMGMALVSLFLVIALASSLFLKDDGYGDE